MIGIAFNVNQVDDIPFETVSIPSGHYLLVHVQCQKCEESHEALGYQR